MSWPVQSGIPLYTPPVPREHPIRLGPVRPTVQLSPRGPGRLAAVLARGEFIHPHRRYRSRSTTRVSRPRRHGHLAGGTRTASSGRGSALITLTPSARSAVDRSRHPTERSGRWCHPRPTNGVGRDRQNQADMGSSPEAGCGVADRFCVAVVVQLNESMNKAPVV